MTELNYRTTFKFSAAHFNSRKTYETYWALVNGQRPNDDELKAAFLDSHGHNFKVEIDATGEQDEEGWIIDDVAMAKMIKPYDGINLSVLPEFVEKKERSTTENLATHIKRKLHDQWPDVHFVVRVWETDDIYAMA
jgi:6-pyruvoyl-tetrahydropterin synthase